MNIYTQLQKNSWPFNVWPHYRQTIVIFANFCWNQQKKQKQNFKFFIKGYFGTKFQLPNYPPPPSPVHQMSIKNSIQNRVNSYITAIFLLAAFQNSTRLVSYTNNI